MTLVAISASYGAGGSLIGPAVAERLGVPFVDRAIPLQVAERLDVPVDDAAAHYDHAGGSWLERMLRGFIGLETGAPAPLPADTFSAEDFHRATQEALTRQAATGEGVILGRGAVVVLTSALRVRLSGPPERRVAQAVRHQGLEQATAEEALRRLDRAHAEYMRHFYGVDVDDPRLYHLVLDSTAIEIEACIEMIVQAAQALVTESALA